MSIERSSPTPPDAEGLPALEARVRRDLEDLGHRPANWVPPRERDGRRVLDVAVVGGGMCGLLAWHALRSGGITGTRVLDRRERGLEGPWVTYARMETLRSPKHLPGPAYGTGALTFRSWHRARFGDAAWGALDKIPRPMWMDYLRWYRHVLEVPVENGVGLRRVGPAGDGLLRLDLDGPGGAETVIARKLVMATGRDGTGAPQVPAFMDGVPRGRWAHSSDDIDFAALRGRRVAVVGVGASAVENGAEAAEAGAAEVRFLVRRPEMPRVNKMMGIGSFGFTCGYPELSDEWRWRFMRYSFVTQTPPPRGSTARASRHRQVHYHFGKAVERVAPEGRGLRLHMLDGTELTTDYVILGTGFTVDPLARTEFGPAAGEIELWRDAYRPPEDERDETLAAFPYLDHDFTFRERVPGAAPWLGSVYCFNYGASASLGKVSGDIPAISEGAAWLARAVAGRLYAEDVELHWKALRDYARPELTGDEWTESEMPDEGPRAARRRGAA